MVVIAPIHFTSAGAVPRPSSTPPESPAAGALSDLDDKALVKRFDCGDETAFREIMARYQRRLFVAALSKLHDHSDAQEIVQDTFIRAHRGLAKFRGDSSLATWLYRIALNLASNRYWYYHRRRRHLMLSLEGAFDATGGGSFNAVLASDEADPARGAGTQEISELAERCMAQLGKNARDILTLRNAENRSYDEIARELGISPGTVKSRIARARERLRYLMNAACPEFDEHTGANDWFEPVRSASRHAPTTA